MSNDNLYQATPPLPFVRITDDQILAVLNGELVAIQGPKYLHIVSLTKGDHSVRNPFTVKFGLGEINADEANIRLIRFI